MSLFTCISSSVHGSHVSSTHQNSEDLLYSQQAMTRERVVLTCLVAVSSCNWLRDSASMTCHPTCGCNPGGMWCCMSEHMVELLPWNKARNGPEGMSRPVRESRRRLHYLGPQRMVGGFTKFIKATLLEAEY